MVSKKQKLILEQEENSTKTGIVIASILAIMFIVLMIKIAALFLFPMIGCIIYIGSCKNKLKEIKYKLAG